VNPLGGDPLDPPRPGTFGIAPENPYGFPSSGRLPMSDVERDRARLDTLDRVMSRLLDRHLVATSSGNDRAADRVRRTLDRLVAEREAVLTRLGRGRAPSTGTERQAAARARFVEAHELDHEATALIATGVTIERLAGTSGAVAPEIVRRVTVAAQRAQRAARTERIRAAHRIETGEIPGRNRP
jgi:hypothetical protein